MLSLSYLPYLPPHLLPPPSTKSFPIRLFTGRRPFPSTHPPLSLSTGWSAVLVRTRSADLPRQPRDHRGGLALDRPATGPSAAATDDRESSRSEGGGTITRRDDEEEDQEEDAMEVTGEEGGSEIKNTFGPFVRRNNPGNTGLGWVGQGGWEFLFC